MKVFDKGSGKVMPARAALALGVCLSSLCSALCWAQAPDPVTPTKTAISVASELKSPALRRLDAAKRQIATNPKRVQSYNDLAIALIGRARETSNPAYYKEAEEAVSKGLALEPGNFSLEKTQVALMLARHDYAQAKTKATAMNQRIPDDVMVYGYLAEADMALGYYSEAETSGQWMMNMRPNNIPALMIGAQLRDTYGDPEGALEFLNLAYSETSPTETEELAWIANQIAAIQIETGKSDAAEGSLKRAEELFSHYALNMENLARVRMRQHRAAEAVTLLVAAKQVDPDIDVLYQLADAQIAAGAATEAAATYAEFEKQAILHESDLSAASRDLVMMYAKGSATAPKALTLAEAQIKARHDVWTQDGYAWALSANGKYHDADAAERQAIAVGVQSPQIFNHEGHIAQKLGNTADAAKYFEASMRVDPESEFAADSRRFLGAHTEGVKVEQAGSAQQPATATVPQLPWPPAATVGKSSPPNTDPNAGETGVSIALPVLMPAFSAVPETLLVPRPTDTERQIRKAQATVTRTPRDPAAYAGLGAAYYQRARETGDVNDYQLAEESLTRSLDLGASDFAADAPLQTMAEVCMGEHRFDDALAYSQRALALGSGDLSPFAIVGDADADKGEYEKAALDYARLSAPGADSSPRIAYARDSRVAYLKFISGDTSGAVRLMRTAVAEGTQAQLPAENLAWLYFELGEFSTQAGDVAAADAAYLSALAIHPGDYRALAGLGKLRSNQGHYADAIVLYQRAIAVVPMPIFIAELGDLYAKTGDMAQAKKQFQLVEYIGLLGHINQVLHNRDLALFYADHDIKLDEALELARKEFEVRHDVYTWDALAWALYKNGKYEEAAKASDKALQSGTRDSLLLYHAGMIAERRGQRDHARDELKEALIINPHFHVLYADAAQQQLTLLGSQASSQANEANHAQ